MAFEWRISSYYWTENHIWGLDFMIYRILYRMFQSRLLVCIQIILKYFRKKFPSFSVYITFFTQCHWNWSYNFEIFCRIFLMNFGKFWQICRNPFLTNYARKQSYSIMDSLWLREALFHIHLFPALWLLRHNSARETKKLKIEWKF